MTHACPIRGCPVQNVQDSRLMCPDHWWMVPLPLRNTIVRLWASGKAKDGHAEACANAIAQVNEKLNGRPT